MQHRIRDFAWITVAIVVGLAWYIDRITICADAKKLTTKLQLVGEKAFGIFDMNLSDEENALRWFNRQEAETLASVLESFGKERRCEASEDRDFNHETK